MTDIKTKDLSETMTKADALQVLSVLAMRIAKHRSIQLEALGYKEQAWHDLGDIEQQVILFMNPGLFGQKPDILDIVVKALDKGDDIHPIDLHNILYFISRDEYLYRVISMWNPTLLSNDFPRWVGGWSKEV